MFAEVRSTHCYGPLFEPGLGTDEKNPDFLAGITIDTWKTDDDNEGGEVVAKVLLSTTGSILTVWCDNGVRYDKSVLENIDLARAALRTAWAEHTAQSAHQNPEIQVETPVGILVARSMPCGAEYPGIDIVLRQPSSPVEMNVALVEVNNVDGDEMQGKLVSRIWGDAEKEDYTDMVCHEHVAAYFQEEEKS